MPKKKNTTKKAEASEPDSFTFSTRVTQLQKEWIERAAALRGWSPSNFLRVAAIDRATNIINTSTRTKFDIRGFARVVAKQLIEPDVWVTTEPYGERMDPDHPGYPDDINTVAACFSPATVETLRNAVKFGGAEFLAQIVDAIDDMRAPGNPELPDPITSE
jgi:uncharacterized protein (DUF1778 family)